MNGGGDTAADRIAVTADGDWTDDVGAVCVPFQAVHPVVPGGPVTRYFVVPDVRVNIDGRYRALQLRLSGVR